MHVSACKLTFRAPPTRSKAALPLKKPLRHLGCKEMNDCATSGRYTKLTTSGCTAQPGQRRTVESASARPGSSWCCSSTQSWPQSRPHALRVAGRGEGCGKAASTWEAWVRHNTHNTHNGCCVCGHARKAGRAKGGPAPPRHTSSAEAKRTLRQCQATPRQQHPPSMLQILTMLSMAPDIKRCGSHAWQSSVRISLVCPPWPEITSTQHRVRRFHNLCVCVCVCVRACVSVYVCV